VKCPKEKHADLSIGIGLKRTGDARPLGEMTGEINPKHPTKTHAEWDALIFLHEETS
jgi:hypothetical protein